MMLQAIVTNMHANNDTDLWIESKDLEDTFYREHGSENDVDIVENFVCEQDIQLGVLQFVVLVNISPENIHTCHVQKNNSAII